MGSGSDACDGIIDAVSCTSLKEHAGVVCPGGHRSSVRSLYIRSCGDVQVDAEAFAIKELLNLNRNSLKTRAKRVSAIGAPGAVPVPVRNAVEASLLETNQVSPTCDCTCRKVSAEAPKSARGFSDCNLLMNSDLVLASRNRKAALSSCRRVVFAWLREDHAAQNNMRS